MSDALKLHGVVGGGKFKKGSKVPILSIQHTLDPIWNIDAGSFINGWYSLAASPDGSFIVGGTGRGEIHKYDKDGNLMWKNTDFYSTSRRVNGLAVDIDGSVFAVILYWGSGNYCYLIKLNPDGTKLWELVTSTSLYTILNVGGVAIDDTYVYVADIKNLTKVRKDTGNAEWSKGGTIYDTAVDNEGNVFIGGAGAGGATVNKYAHDGSLLWSKTPDTSITSDKFYSVDVDPDGNVYAGGNYFEVVKFDADGNQVWFYDNYSSGAAFDVKYTPDGIYLVSVFNVVKLNLDGSIGKKWTYRDPFTGNEIVSICLDGNLALYHGEEYSHITKTEEYYTLL